VYLKGYQLATFCLFSSCLSGYKEYNQNRLWLGAKGKEEEYE